MTVVARGPELKSEPPLLPVPDTASVTSDFEISREVWIAYLAKLDEVEDMSIVLEVKARRALVAPTELEDFMREQGYDPAEFQA